MGIERHTRESGMSGVKQEKKITMRKKSVSGWNVNTWMTYDEKGTSKRFNYWKGKKNNYYAAEFLNTRPTWPWPTDALPVNDKTSPRRRKCKRKALVSHCSSSIPYFHSSTAPADFLFQSWSFYSDSLSSLLLNFNPWLLPFPHSRYRSIQLTMEGSRNADSSEKPTAAEAPQQTPGLSLHLDADPFHLFGSWQGEFLTGRKRKSLARQID